MFKKKSAKGNIRKRERSTERQPDQELPEDKVIIVRPNVARPVPRTIDDSLDDDGGDDTFAEDSNSPPMVLEGTGLLTKDTAFRSSGKTESSQPKDMGATATAEYDTAQDRDKTSLEQRRMELDEELAGKEDDGVYRGQAGYAQYYKKKDSIHGNATSSKMGVGPKRASSNIRVTCRFDYQPDVCKDYKETGYCGYGDSCKFMHDRGDYKQGWQIDKDYEKEQRTLREAELRSEIADAALDPNAKKKEEELPFACLICRKDFTRPIVTKCKHNFFEACAIKHFKKSAKCFACGKATEGVFLPAKNLQEKLLERKVAASASASASANVIAG